MEDKSLMYFYCFFKIFQLLINIQIQNLENKIFQNKLLNKVKKLII